MMRKILEQNRQVTEQSQRIARRRVICRIVEFKIQHSYIMFFQFNSLTISNILLRILSSEYFFETANALWLGDKCSAKKLLQLSNTFTRLAKVNVATSLKGLSSGTAFSCLAILKISIITSIIVACWFSSLPIASLIGFMTSTNWAFESKWRALMKYWTFRLMIGESSLLLLLLNIAETKNDLKLCTHKQTWDMLYHLVLQRVVRPFFTLFSFIQIIALSSQKCDEVKNAVSFEFPLWIPANQDLRDTIDTDLCHSNVQWIRNNCQLETSSLRYLLGNMNPNRKYNSEWLPTWNFVSSLSSRKYES